MEDSLIDLTEVGYEIETAHSERLQELVSDKLLREAEVITFSRISLNPRSSEVLSALAALHEIPQVRRKKIVLHPSFRYWLRAMRRTVQAENLEQHYSFAWKLVDFVWSEQASMGQLSRSFTTMTDEQGGLRCPSMGRFIELGPSYADCIVQITPSNEGVILNCADGLTIQVPVEDLNGLLVKPLPTLEDHGYLVSVSPSLVDGCVEVSSRDPWLRVRLTGSNQRTTGTQFFGADTDQCYPSSPSLTNLKKALQILKNYWTEEYNDLARFTHVIVPMNFGPHRHCGFTVSSRQGAIYIGNAPPNPTVEMLIHENAHLKLRQIQYLDSLLIDPSDESLCLPVPWRADPRPLPGIFEGLFVFSHVAEFELRRLLADGTGVDSNQLEQRIHSLYYAAKCLERHAVFTEIGGEFFRSMLEWVEKLSERFTCAGPFR
jgi:HEXXH motif-containing protein